MKKHALFFAVAALGLLVSACELIASVDRSKIPAETTDATVDVDSGQQGGDASLSDGHTADAHVADDASEADSQTTVDAGQDAGIVLPDADPGLPDADPGLPDVELPPV